ncbi:hypothetical protein LPJ56_002219 [Coemansia sp. RSA 2599]|nr:hypothetical protein LPJ56_002219 [Coemansia sp. RSA 2599]
MLAYYYQGFHGFQSAGLIINLIGYYPCRVATLVIVLAYPAERWKARALGVFLLIEYLTAAIGDIIAIKNRDTSGGSQRLTYSIVYLCLTSIAPFLAIGIAPSEAIVRSNGVYLISPETNFKTEIREIKRLLFNKNVLFLVPYMFFYPMYFSVANIELPDPLLIVMYDIGKVLILVMAQLLDVPWTTRRMRGYAGLAVVVVFYIVSFSVITVVRARYFDLTGYDPSWPKDRIQTFLADALVDQQYKILLCVLFFGGVISGLTEIYGYWVIGTLTNDLKSSARFVGTYHTFMAVGGLVGFEIAKKDGLPAPAYAGYYVAAAGSFLSFILVYFVVRQITETNNWSLGSIAGEEAFHMEDNIGANHTAAASTGTVGAVGTTGTGAAPVQIVPDVKHHYTQQSFGRGDSIFSL